MNTVDHPQQAVQTDCQHDQYGRGGGTHVMHGRSRVAIEPRPPTMPGRSTSGVPTKTHQKNTTQNEHN